MTAFLNRSTLISTETGSGLRIRGDEKDDVRQPNRAGNGVPVRGNKEDDPCPDEERSQK